MLGIHAIFLRKFYCWFRDTTTHSELFGFIKDPLMDGVFEAGAAGNS